MEAMTNGIVPTLDYSRNNDGFGEGSWFWIIIILFAFWGNGFNRNNNLETDIDTRFLERDIFNTNQNVSNTACTTQRDVLENRYALGTQILENRFNCSQNACNTQKEVLESRYTTQLGFQNMQANLSDCCCKLENAIHAEGEATRNLMQQDKIEQLREQVNTSNLALFGQQIVNQILPRSVPAYPSCSPYVPATYGYGYKSGCGCGNTTII